MSQDGEVQAVKADDGQFMFWDGILDAILGHMSRLAVGLRVSKVGVLNGPCERYDKTMLTRGKNGATDDVESGRRQG